MRTGRIAGCAGKIRGNAGFYIEAMPPGIIRCHHGCPDAGWPSFMMPGFIAFNFKVFIKEFALIEQPFLVSLTNNGSPAGFIGTRAILHAIFGWGRSVQSLMNSCHRGHINDNLILCRVFTFMLATASRYWLNY
jgi:hypothetical protein